MVFSCLTMFLTRFSLLARKKNDNRNRKLTVKHRARKSKEKLVKIRRHMAYFRDCFEAIRAYVRQSYVSQVLKTLTIYLLWHTQLIVCAAKC